MRCLGLFGAVLVRLFLLKGQYLADCQSRRDEFVRLLMLGGSVQWMNRPISLCECWRGGSSAGSESAAGVADVGGGGAV